MRKFLAITTLCLLLAACEARLEMRVRNDGSGQMGFSFLAEEQMVDAMKAFGGDPFDEMRKDLANDPVDWKVANISEGDQSGIRAVFEFVDVADLKTKLDALDAEDGDDPFVDGELTLERSGSGWRFQAKANAPNASDLAPQPPAPPPGAPPGFEQANPLTGLDSMLGNMRFVFRVTLPGAPGSTNATKVGRTADGTRFEWTFKANGGGGQQLMASTTAAAAGGRRGFPAMPVAVASVFAGAVGAVLMVRRRPKTPTVPLLEGFPVPAPVGQPSVTGEAGPAVGVESVATVSADAVDRHE